MSTEFFIDDLEKEIILMEQELILKRKMVDEYKEKLNSEIFEHALTKSNASKFLNENKELQIQLEVYLKGSQKLEEENNKNRELLVRLQAKSDAYLTERQQLVDSCYHKEKENNALKNELAELKEQLQAHLMFLENLKQKKTKTEALITEIMSKQEVLNQEQVRLEAVCKEGLRFAEKLSEEANFQVKFVQEAKIGQAKMESEIIRLMAALSEFKAEKEIKENESPKSENTKYLEMWKINQKEMKTRNEELQEVNKRLQEELNYANEQLEILIKNY